MIWYCGAACQTSHWKYHKTACRLALPDDEKEATILDGLDGERRGKMGLRNLGNTCFMNSALQCLSHTDIITKFFLSNEYLKDINRDNPLGTGGNLATEYDNLLKELWFGTTPSMNPASFKRAIGRFAPQFSGFQQHDSQELLAYILDGLHEDLNRVKHKPYTEVKESDGSTDDAIIAKEAWERHLLRNDSIFVDHVQGQFKSTVVCPICAKVSITFDPFNCIQLELPTRQTRKMEVIFVPTKGIMTRYAVDVPKKGGILNVKEALSQLCGVAPSRMVTADIYQSMTYRVLGYVRTTTITVPTTSPRLAVRKTLGLTADTCFSCEFAATRKGWCGSARKTASWRTRWACQARTLRPPPTTAFSTTGSTGTWLATRFSSRSTPRRRAARTFPLARACGSL